MANEPRESIINVCYENHLFHNPRDVIITSQIDVSELVDNDIVLPLAVPLVKYTPLVVVIMTFTNVSSHETVSSL